MWVIHRYCCTRKVNNWSNLNFSVDRCPFMLLFSTGHVLQNGSIKSYKKLLNKAFQAINFAVNKFFWKLDHMLFTHVRKKTTVHEAKDQD